MLSARQPPFARSSPYPRPPRQLKGLVSQSWGRKLRSSCSCVAAQDPGGPEGASDKDLKGEVAPMPQTSQKLATTKAPSGASSAAMSMGRSVSIVCGTSVLLLVVLNATLFGLVVYGRVTAVAAIALDGMTANPAWWTFVSSAFVHANLEHLFRNCGIVFLFAQPVEAELSGLGVWFTYIMCALGANLSAWWLLSAKAKAAGVMLGLASTGAALGLVLLALAMSFQPTLAWFVGASLTSYLVLIPLLSTPVPFCSLSAMGALSKFTGILGNYCTSLTKAGCDVRGGLANVVGAAKACACDPSVSWMWGVVAVVAIVALLARIPLPDDDDAFGPSTSR